jgi:sodium/potassium-transporting ATPase subunit alpha
MDSKTVERLTLLYGKNQLTEKKPVPWFVKIFHELTTVFSMMMWICAALCFIVFALSSSDPSNVYK